MVESTEQNLQVDEKLPLLHAKQHYGKSMMKQFPKDLKHLVKQAAVKAEQDKGGPVLKFDIKIALIEILKDQPQDEQHKKVRLHYSECLNDMWRTDEILIDEAVFYWSLVHQDKFWTYSDAFETMFAKDFTLDENLRFMPKSHIQINFDWLKDLYLSKDLTRLDELRQLGKDPKFLDSSVDLSGNKITFASYPRTGNTMLKSLIEECTGIVTGSDQVLQRVVTGQFMLKMVGHQHFGSNAIWVTKTHYPLNKKDLFTADKIIYITRNPCETVPSQAIHQVTATHSLVSEKPLNEYTDFWNYYVPFTLDCISKFNDHIVKQSEVTPTLFLRYEDLREDSYTPMAQLIAFMLGVNSIEGTVIEARVKEVCAVDVTQKSRYALKTTTKNYNRNAHLYTPEQIECCTNTLREHNIFFGYAEMEGVENVTGYYKYTDEHQDELANNFRKYKTLNDAHFNQEEGHFGNVPMDKREVWKVNGKDGACNMPAHMKKCEQLLPDDFRVKEP